jgi:biopolymer transport protein TolQ
MELDFTVWHLVRDASLLVQLVMLVLLVGSIASWMIIIRKRSVLSAATRQADKFEEQFWSGADLTQLFDGINKSDRKPQGMERIFEAGFREFARMRQSKRATPESLVEAAQRSMRIALTREMDRLEHHLNFLATVGSTSPYVGLFGTVWGIMNSFRELANVSQATIQNVAPGISEALVATAMGLFAAIPAVIAYNRYSNDVDRLEVRYDNFKEEFSSVLQRQANQ